MNPATESLPAHEDMELGTLLELFWSRRWLIVGSAVFFTAAATIAAFVMTPVYRATAVLVPAEVEGRDAGALSAALGSLGGLASLAGANLGSRDNATEEALAVLRSRAFTESFIRDRELMPMLFESDWDTDANQWLDSADPPTMAEGFKYFNERVRGVARDTRTGLVLVRIDWRDPTQAADWANDLVARLNAEMRARAIARTNASVGYLEQEMAKTSNVELRTAISRLMEAQIHQRMLANVTEEYAFRIVDKALPADEDDPIRPRKLVMMIAGMGAGLFIAVIAVVLLRRRP
jgi:uncharacterized protein involved in exopolysaccharide biosynthesis